MWRGGMIGDEEKGKRKGRDGKEEEEEEGLVSIR